MRTFTGGQLAWGPLVKGKLLHRCLMPDRPPCVLLMAHYLRLGLRDGSASLMDLGTGDQSLVITAPANSELWVHDQ